MDRACSWSLACLVLFTCASLGSDDQDRLQVGVQPDGRIVVPTNQILTPAGRQITFPGRPVDLAFTDDGRTLVVKNRSNLVFIDVATAKVKQTLTPTARQPVKPTSGNNLWPYSTILKAIEMPSRNQTRPGFSVVGLWVQGNKVYAGDALSQVQVAERQADGSYRWGQPINLTQPKVGGDAHPAGLAGPAAGELWVTSTRGNNVQQIDLATGKVKQLVPVGVAPYLICFLDADTAYVSNWGGDPPKKGEPQATSSDTPIRIDPRTGVANDGTVSKLKRFGDGWKQVKTIRAGLHPSGLLLSRQHRFLYVANANSDTVSVIDTKTDAVVETIPCRPEARLPFGSGSNALAVSPDGGSLYVANGTNNCVAVVRLAGTSSEGTEPARPPASTVVGLIPTAWYPGALLLSPDGKRLFVANVKGHGSLSQPRPVAKGKTSHDHLGSVSIIDLPDAAQLAHYTAEVNANNRLAYSLAGLDKPRPTVKPLPVPARHGEPSVFKHVIFIIKENRTYDQILGDMPEGNGDPRLVMFGEDVTPNHHALARQFTLYDNFYCSGVLSADGHVWITEAIVSDYLEKAFGGFTRSYPDDGSDPLAYVPAGFLWDNALAHRKTFRNYGEFITSKYIPERASWADVYADFKNGTRKVRMEAKANLKTLEPYTHPNYLWFPLQCPDVYRARMFIDELKECEKKGAFPNLVYLTLPCDHTTGTRADFPTPRASVADNDLALGQLVEAVSRSKFWADTCIFVVEDDPQNGFDHVDAHRSVALVISPYTKRRFVDHTNYNQTGMVKTIELMLGLPPMNQLDLSATPMRGCFQNKPNLTPYACLPNRIPLDEMNSPLGKLKGKALYWAKKSHELDLDEGDAADEDTLNRILWHATRGYDTPYPERFAGVKEE